MKKTHMYDFAGKEQCKVSMSEEYNDEDLKMYDNFALCGTCNVWDPTITKVKSNVTCKACIKKISKLDGLKVVIKGNCLVWEKEGV